MYRSGPVRCRPRRCLWRLLLMHGTPACRELFRCQIAETRHSSLSLPLKLSMKPFCCGLPGAM